MSEHLPQISSEPCVYERFGVRFQYPSNWKLTEEQTEGYPIGITLQSPTSAFWSLNLHRPLYTPETLADQVIDTLRADYTDCEAERGYESCCGFQAVTDNLMFYYLDLLIHAHVQVMEVGEMLFVILAQAEEHDFQNSDPVFQAITASLLQPAE